MEIAQGKVACVRCLEAFEEFADGQAYDCACVVDGAYVHGAYGSAELDMESAIFAVGDDHGLPAGLLCDSCIRDLQVNGELIEGPSHIPSAFR